MTVGLLSKICPSPALLPFLGVPTNSGQYSSCHITLLGCFWAVNKDGWNDRRKNCWKASSSNCSRRSTSRSSTCASFRTCVRRCWLISRTRTSLSTSTSNSTTWTSTRTASRSSLIQHDVPKSNSHSLDYLTSSSSAVEIFNWSIV